MSAVPATVDLRWYRGDTSSQQFRLLDAPDVPTDLTGATAAAWAVNGRAPGHILTVTIDADPTTGLLVLSPPVNGIDAGNYQYDLEITAANSTITTWVKGRLTVDQDITNG